MTKLKINSRKCKTQTPAIKISCWNIHGLISKEQNKLEEESFLSYISDKDIVFLTETKCLKSQELNVPGYYCFQLNRTSIKTAKTESGGIALLCKSHYRQGISILPIISEDFFWIKLNKQFFNISEDLYICAVYDPPPGSSYSQRQIRDPLETIEENVIEYSKKGNIMLLGDFNARTGNLPDYVMGDSDIIIPMYTDDTIPNRLSQDHTTDTRGKHLLEICIQSQLRILNGRCLGDSIGAFTCHTYNGSSTVDYSVISENLYNDIIYFHVEKFDGTLSDHSMITTMIRTHKPIDKKQDNHALHKINKTSRWSEKVQSFYLENINKGETKTEINNLNENCFPHNIECIVNNLSKCLLKNLPQCSPRVKHRRKIRNNSKKWFSNSLYQLRQAVIRKGQLMSENPFDKSIRLSFFCLKKKFRKACKFKQRTYKSDLVKKLEKLHFENPKQYWRLLNELLGNQQEKSNPGSFISPGDWYDYLFHLKTDNKISIIETELKTKLLELENTKVFNELDFRITHKEVQKAITKLKNNKSPGLDGICNEMLKCSNEPIIALITKIFNTVLLTGTYPKIWNKGYVSAIHKSKNKEDPNNYRCLTINSSFGKLFNQILNNRLNDFLVKNEIIHPCQIGFQKNKRTADHIYTLNTVIKKYTKLYKKKIYACFVDLRKAFDKVWHTGLLFKLQMVNVSTNFYNIIKCMYSENEICMKFNDYITDYLKPTLGVKQGDNLSSSLFNIYINDIISYFTHDCSPIIIGDQKIHCLMFADDLIILSESATGLQKSLDILHNYCNTWKLEINESKSKVIIFESKKQSCNTNFLIGNTNLERVYEYKYLGITIDYKGELNKAKEELYSRSQKAYFKLRKLLAIDIINPKLYLDIFDKTVIPILTYGSELWGTFNIKTKRYKNNGSPEYLYEELIGEKLHTKLCKILLGVHQKASNIATRAELGRYPIMITILANIISYRHRLENLENNILLQNSFNDDVMLYESGIVSWYSCSQEILRLTEISNAMIKKLTSKTIRKKAIKKLNEMYDTYFRNAIFNDKRKDPNEQNKLRTYRLFKQTIHYEPYLNLKLSKNIMKKYSQFRLSAHKLNIETARHIRTSKDQRNQQKLIARKCTKCQLNEDEDEFHFLMICSKYDDERTIFLEEIYKDNKNTRSLSMKEMFIWLLSNEDDRICNRLVRFVNQTFKIREST